MKMHPAITLCLVAMGLLTVPVVACGEKTDGDPNVGDGYGGYDGYGGGDGDRLDPPGTGHGDGDKTGVGGGEGGEGGAATTELPPISSQGDPLNLPALNTSPPCGLANAPYLIGGNVDASGYLLVQDNISSAGSLGMGGASPLDDATQLDGATSHTVFPDGTAYVSYWEKPIIERWEVGTASALEKKGVLQLASAGVSSTGSTRQLVQIMGATKAYYVDPENNYVLGFNPSTMRTDGVFIDLTEGLGPAGEFMALGDVHRDGEHLIISARYWDEDFNVEPIIRAAFIDSSNDSVTFAEDTRCGDVAWHATDSAGNLYLGSHYDNVGANYVEEFGVRGTDSCIVRINRGERNFDQGYYIDMDELVGGIGTTLLQGPGDQAYVMKYAGAPITRENWDDVRGGATWELYAMTLGSEVASLKQVDFGGEKFNPTPTLFCADNTQAIIGLSGTDFESGQLFVIDTAGASTAALRYPGALGRGVSLQ